MKSFLSSGWAQMWICAHTGLLGAAWATGRPTLPPTHVCFFFYVQSRVTRSFPKDAWATSRKHGNRDVLFRSHVSFIFFGANHGEQSPPYLLWVQWERIVRSIRALLPDRPVSSRPRGSGCPVVTFPASQTRTNGKNLNETIVNSDATYYFFWKGNSWIREE